MPLESAPPTSSDNSAVTSTQTVAAAEAPKDLVCGLVMPLANTAGCPPSHWLEVRTIIQEAVKSIQEYDFQCDMVSNANESAVIQTSIVQNLNSNDIVVCDVSGKNPNVMFELGMRVAFDKPVVVIKDDQTDFSFDTSPIAHLIYPRDLRYSAMQAFKLALAGKVVATYKKHLEGGSGSSYLASFGPIKVAHLQTQEVPLGELVVGRLNDIQDQLSMVVSMSRSSRAVSTATMNELLQSTIEITEREELLNRSSRTSPVGIDMGLLKIEFKKFAGPVVRNTPVGLKKAEVFIQKKYPILDPENVRWVASTLLDDLKGADE